MVSVRYFVSSILRHQGRNDYEAFGGTEACSKISTNEENRLNKAMKDIFSTGSVNETRATSLDVLTQFPKMKYNGGEVAHIGPDNHFYLRFVYQYSFLDQQNRFYGRPNESLIRRLNLPRQVTQLPLPVVVLMLEYRRTGMQFLKSFSEINNDWVLSPPICSELGLLGPPKLQSHLTMSGLAGSY